MEPKERGDFPCWKKALALEGGSLRCMFSAGAVDVMMEQGLLFDGVFGVSAGALTGINYVSRQIGRTARINLEYVNDKRYLGVRNLLLHRSIFNFDFMFGELSDRLIPLDREAVRTTPCRFTAVATDCRTGQTVYFEKSATPGHLPGHPGQRQHAPAGPHGAGGGPPLPGRGVSTSIPFQRPLEEGYRKVVVLTTREHGYRKEPVAPGLARVYARAYRKYPELVKAVLSTPRRYGRELDLLDQLEAQGKVFVLRPPVPVTVSRTEKDVAKLQALYDQGRETCLARLEELKAYLEA